MLSLRFGAEDPENSSTDCRLENGVLGSDHSMNTDSSRKMIERPRWEYQLDSIKFAPQFLRLHNIVGNFINKPSLELRRIKPRQWST